MPSEHSDILWLRLLHADNEPCWCELRLQAMANQQFSATLVDISNQIHTDQRKDASHRSLSSLIQRLPAMLYRSRNDRDWTMEYVSEGCRELTGYEPEHMMTWSQHTFGELIYPEDADRIWQQVQQALQQHRSFEIRYRLFHRDGSLRQVIEKGSGVYTRSGAILAVEGVIFACDDRHFYAARQQQPQPELSGF